MELLSNWVRGVIAIVAASSFIELLLPSGSMKKYVRFASGLIVIILVIKPLFDLRKIELPEVPPPEQGQYQSADVSALFTKHLESDIKQRFGVSVEVTVNTERPGEIVYVKTIEKKAEIANYLGLSLDKVGD